MSQKRYFVRTLLKRARLSTCPFCADKDPNFGEIWVESPNAMQDGDCSACGGEWREHYRMYDVTILVEPGQKKQVAWDDYDKRVQDLEAEGLTTSDAQAVADLELMNHQADQAEHARDLREDR